ncbi:sugar transferase [Lapidilactobacillus luobeiensis]|uniref:sugar transferase n=1 Tax=Lapidilactobacillus luobeiensis TaxID=2950371 RepID=UPI0021C35561
MTVDWWQDAHAAGRLGYVLIKRVFDFFASFVGLILLSPLFLVIAVMIKLDDPAGPVFYSQQRLGRKEREFRMFKFRSMCVDADKKLKELLDKNEVDGAMFKMKEDPRITKIGHFIRRTSIDELPQLLNVFLGDMSLVGPRPPLPREIAQYSDYDRKRLAVKPGCTGLWQVSGRNDVGFKEMVELDIRYIEKRSIFLDLKIIFRTVGIMLRPNGAY